MSSEKTTLTPTLRLSEMAENLVGSEIIKLAGEIKAKIAGGERIHNFTIGDFNPEIFPIPEKLLNAIIEAYRNGHTNYPAANGMQPLRESVARYIKREQGLDYDADSFLISGGARPLIYATYQAIVDPQDKVIFPVPSWNNNHYTHLAHGQKVMLETSAETHFMPTADMLRPHVKGATLIALCSPLNPTGTTFTREQLQDICDLVLEENARRAPDEKPLYLMFDQIYWQLTYGETQHFDPVSLAPEMRNYTIFIDGISKAFSATGVRVGWAFGPERVIGKMKSILSHIGAWSPKAEQMATAFYLDQSQDVTSYLDGMREQVLARLTGFYNGFQTLKSEGHKVDAIVPQAAIYLTVQIDIKGKRTKEGELLDSSKKITGFLLSEAKLAIVPFYAFGASQESDWYRLSVGTSVKEAIPEVIDQLRAALNTLT